MLGKSGEGLGLEWKNGASLEGLTNNCQFEYCFDDIEICSLSFKYASVNFENECCGKMKTQSKVAQQRFINC